VYIFIFIKIYIFINKHEIKLKSGVLQINCVDERDRASEKKTLINHFHTHAHIVRLRNYEKKVPIIIKLKRQLPKIGAVVESPRISYISS